MTPEEVFDLLTLIAIRDNRTVGRTTAIVWHEDIGDLAFADCREAVARHFRESTEWLMPATVRTLVKAIRADRLDGFQYAPTPRDEDPEVYLEELRRQRQAVADGRRSGVPELPAGEDRSEEIAAMLERAFPRPDAEAAKAERQPAETAEQTRARMLSEAYGYLLVIPADAADRAFAAARDQLGADAERHDLVLLAARLADAKPLPPSRPDKATADLMAAQGCPNGCPLGSHDPSCHFAGGRS